LQKIIRRKEMKNIERQKQLDEKKWIESEKQEFDMSGKMPWCSYCGMQGFDLCGDGKDKGIPTICTSTQEERESQCFCATAYNRMKRSQR
jgi:hypothetical protein